MSFLISFMSFLISLKNMKIKAKKENVNVITTIIIEYA